MSSQSSWPPSMSWTALAPYKGESHFVAITYGIKAGKRFVNLVSVLYGDIFLSITFDELNDLTKWKPGWIEIANESTRTNFLKTKDLSLISSEDSGLPLPLSLKGFRSW